METEEPSGINVQSFCDEQEWQLHSHIETWTKVISRTYQTNESKHRIYSTACRASRRPGFFIWNVFLVMVSSYVINLTCLFEKKGNDKKKDENEDTKEKLKDGKERVGESGSRYCTKITIFRHICHAIRYSFIHHSNKMRPSFLVLRLGL